MAQTIRRKQTGVRRQARKQDTRRQVRKAQAHTSTLVDALIRVLPFTEEQLHRFFLFLILLAAAVGAWFVASMAGLNMLVGQQFASAAANAGFEVNRVEVHGVKRMNELKVYERVLGAKDRAMPQVDLDEMRASLLGLHWVEDARVSRQLPDTIVIDIVERTPHAVLARPDRLVLIDGTGHELEPISRANAKGMLRISGPGAQAQVQNLSTLLDAAPALRPQVAAAEWIGNRRWNLTFKSGQLLSLPMGDKDAAGALINFAQLDGVHRLLGGKVVAFDMRSPERIYMRCPDCKEADKPDLSKGTT
ncbi:FtsQ-type POTRA domain-containing protein [Altererythrobacter salegens]|uniref:Cell division protein FtsQ n=1 Tax=Croceibacterium salegens TaxID=1737568 RepID=A0A6I4SQ97_9SPHN|nr:cell division protein FtsQ/DivIB [Croceibacterium salegens]MXO58023.1 FtsQ-type POTRA domain-containing protein [Croceibacterium salegens]